MLFILRELMTRDPVVHLSVFRNRTYSAGVFLMTVVGFVLYGSMLLVPIFLQTLLGYSALEAGIAMAPRGLGSFLMMPVLGVGPIGGAWSLYALSEVNLNAILNVDELFAWNQARLRRTAFYHQHRNILEEPRGSGYWLWKPFIIRNSLARLKPGDTLIYSDAGIEIIGDPAPLIELCKEKDTLLFANHYDDMGRPGPNTCAKWTKRDCFVLMDCDDPAFHLERSLDASFLMLTKCKQNLGLIDEWLECCRDRRLLTDQPNEAGQPNLPDFVEHRHDQSILSLLAIRAGIETHRHPSQYGNHLKMKQFRRPGEWKRYGYGCKGIYRNSPYPTVLNHHRGIHVESGIFYTSRRVAARVRAVFDLWTTPEGITRWFGLESEPPQVDFRVGGYASLPLRPQTRLIVTYLEIKPPSSIVFTSRWPMLLTASFREGADETEVTLRHEGIAAPHEEYLHFWNAALDRLAAVFVS